MENHHYKALCQTLQLSILLLRSEQSAQECDASEAEWIDELLVHKNDFYANGTNHALVRAE